MPSKEMFSDASSTGCGAFIKGSSLICHRNWSTEESRKSSTWRELVAIKFALDSFEDHLAGRRICCKTDSQNVVRIVQVGSMIKHCKNVHGTIPQDLLKCFEVLKKCRNKFDCLLYEMLHIRTLKPNLNVQSDSIRAKVFV